MLQVTARAATILKEARSQRGVPETFGLRVAQPTSNSQSPIHLEFAESPALGDEVSEVNGLRLFVAAEVAEPLTEQAIDAQDSASGSGSNLVLREQHEVEE
jgi:Fe-S cluster assembly iron-binding protein IscA